MNARRCGWGGGGEQEDLAVDEDELVELGLHLHGIAPELVPHLLQHVGDGLGGEPLALDGGEGTVEQLHFHQALGGVEQGGFVAQQRALHRAGESSVQHVRAT